MRGKLSKELRRLAKRVAEANGEPWEAHVGNPTRNGMGNYHQDKNALELHPSCGKAVYKKLKRYYMRGQ